MNGNIIIGGSILLIFILTVAVIQMKKEKKETGKYPKNSILIEEFKQKLNVLIETFKNKKTFLKDIEIVKVTGYRNQYKIFFKYENINSSIRYFDVEGEIKGENAHYIITELEKEIDKFKKLYFLIETSADRKIEKFKRNLNILIETYKNKKTFLKDIEIVKVTYNISQYNIFFKYKNINSSIQCFDFNEDMRGESDYYFVTEFEKKIKVIDKRIEKCKEFTS